MSLNDHFLRMHTHTHSFRQRFLRSRDALVYRTVRLSSNAFLASSQTDPHSFVHSGSGIAIDFRLCSWLCSFSLPSDGLSNHHFHSHSDSRVFAAQNVWSVRTGRTRSLPLISTHHLFHHNESYWIIRQMNKIQCGEATLNETPVRWRKDEDKIIFSQTKKGKLEWMKLVCWIKARNANLVFRKGRTLMQSKQVSKVKKTKWRTHRQVMIKRRTSKRQSDHMVRRQTKKRN